MISTVIFCLVLHYATAEYDCPTNIGYSSLCPVRKTVGGVVHCYKLRQADYGSAYTYKSGDEECHVQDQSGEGHLANIYDERTFKDVRCYMITMASIQGKRDPKVLTGMSYSTQTGVTKLYDSSIIRNPYWGQMGRASATGSQMIIRAHEELSRSKMLNFGDADTRYDRILCEYPLRK